MGIHYGMNLGGKLKCIGVEAEEFEGKFLRPYSVERTLTRNCLPFQKDTSFDDMRIEVTIM